MMTKQQVYDKVLFGLREQGEASTNGLMDDGRPEDGYACRYRSDEGLKCAAGMLIDDEHFHLKLEGSTIMNDNVKHALELSGVPLELIPMVREMQEVHDSDLARGGLRDWEVGMKIMAGTNNLVYTPA